MAILCWAAKNSGTARHRNSWHMVKRNARHLQLLAHGLEEPKASVTAGTWLRETLGICNSWHMVKRTARHLQQLAHG